MFLLLLLFFCIQNHGTGSREVVNCGARDPVLRVQSRPKHTTVIVGMWASHLSEPFPSSGKWTEILFTLSKSPSVKCYEAQRDLGIKKYCINYNRPKRYYAWEAPAANEHSWWSQKIWDGVLALDAYSLHGAWASCYLTRGGSSNSKGCCRFCKDIMKFWMSKAFLCKLEVWWR